MNLSETAFLVWQEDGFRLRWFTPTDEVDLCGHATLASAHVLSPAPLGGGRLPHPQRTAHCRAGGRWVDPDGLPRRAGTEAEAPPGLAEALGAELRYVGRNRMDYLVLLESEADVRRLEPDFMRLRAVEARGVIVTAPAGAGDAPYDFVSRFFAPRYGIDEDPVTGSAHCCLGPFWQARLGMPRLTGYQVSPRGGLVRVEVMGERVGLEGQAVTVLRAELLAGTNSGGDG